MFQEPTFSIESSLEFLKLFELFELELWNGTFEMKVWARISF